MQRGERVGGRFEVIAEVGSGGMGTVYRGRDVRTRRDVAIKLIAAETPDEAARFAREVEILAGVRHPGVVGYVAHGPGYLVMEWVEGETLRQRLDRAALTVPGAVAIARQLAAALAALHAAGIVHRDVKPDNIMLAGEQVKLVDFGVARGALGPRVTMTGACVGTAGYMAPEQARGDREITGAADQFALGCVLYECLAGAPAFHGDTALALRAKVLLHDPPPPRALALDVPAVLDELALRLLSRDPAHRPDAAAAEAALAAAEPALATDAAPPGSIAPSTVALHPIAQHLIALHPLPSAPTTEPTAVAAPRPIARSPIALHPLALHPRGSAVADSTTGAAPRPAVCAVLVAIDDAGALDRVPALAEAGAVRFPGGAATTRPDPGAAARLALEIAARLPDAAIAIACDGSPDGAIDRGARLVEQLAIARAAGDPVAGAWLDASAAHLGAELGAGLAAELTIEQHGGRLRLRGPA